jgi:hypothetical protein
MNKTHDRNHRSLTQAIINGTIAGITRTILTWIINHLDL